jgi:uncharacterized protein YutE (UPF0331/DUF86 family)
VRPSGASPASGPPGAAVVLRPDAIRARLLRLEEVLSRLEHLARMDNSSVRPDFREAWARERGLQLAAEIVFDVGNHILSAHFGIGAQDYEDIIARLGEVGVIERGLRERLKGLGGFQNILVHGYLDLDPERVAEGLRWAPADFTDFGLAVRRWLERTTGGP